MSRIVIESVFIKNFRSIRSATITPKHLTVFVGTNDAGKSNFLKALNLFFNNETDYATPFDFQSDFSYLFPETSRSTKEIQIKIKFKIPDSYKDKGVFTWEKTWRASGYYKERIINAKGEIPTAKSRVPSALNRIRFRYVPAVKSSDYYKTLLSDLYLSVSTSIGDTPLTQSTKNFSEALKQHTESITTEVTKKLNLKSELSVPNNLSNIFKSLVFLTQSDDSNVVTVPLTNRGDGIQARHIPIILKYIAEEDQRSRNQGSMKITTIWGFEEPENGLELSKSFSMADDFEEYSKEIQIFTTTHSPAFYMKKNNISTSIYFVCKKDGTDETLYQNEVSNKEIYASMGLMPLVAPFIAEQENKLKKAKEVLTMNFLTDINTVMVEGKTDRDYIQLGIKALSAKLNDMLENQTLRILTKDEGCGTTQLQDWALAWSYSGFNSKLVILFDKDEAGTKSKNIIEGDQTVKARKNTGSSIKTLFIQPSEDVISVLQEIKDFTYSIEHLLPTHMWQALKTKNYVELRSEKELFNIFNAYLEKSKSLDNIIDEKFSEKAYLRDTLVTFNVKDMKKSHTYRLVEDAYNQGDENIFSGFKRTIETLEKALV